MNLFIIDRFTNIHIYIYFSPPTTSACPVWFTKHRNWWRQSKEITRQYYYILIYLYSFVSYSRKLGQYFNIPDLDLCLHGSHVDLSCQIRKGTKRRCFSRLENMAVGKVVFHRYLNPSRDFPSRCCAKYHRPAVAYP